eukprot:TRINITY_DN22412_c0_g3_i1.p1 TRINITY_DN22412_c0_g3~~TRINITY_DN22412_c0_g3_i1.p1  ORF type:complete len:243 (-),score=35.20 TRINITY_DN22412_c0_g3_i1:142-870(-)
MRAILRFHLTVLLLVYFAAAVRVLDEAQGSQSRAVDPCPNLHARYTAASNKIEESVKRGRDLTAPQNTVRLMRAARSLSTGSRHNCSWISELTDDVRARATPFLSKSVEAQIAQRPCGDRVLAYIQSGKLMEAVKMYAAEEGECDALYVAAQDESLPNKTSSAADDEDAELQLRRLEAQVDAAEEQHGTDHGNFSLVELGTSLSRKVSFFMVCFFFVLLHPLLIMTFPAWAVAVDYVMFTFW